MEEVEETNGEERAPGLIGHIHCGLNRV